MVRMHQLENDCINLNILPRPPAGQGSQIVSQIIVNLPERYRLLQRQLLKDTDSYPTLTELTRMLNDEDYIVRNQQSSDQTTVAAARYISETHAEIPEGNHPRRRRRGHGGRVGTASAAHAGGGGAGTHVGTAHTVAAAAAIPVTQRPVTGSQQQQQQQQQHQQRSYGQGHSRGNRGRFAGRRGNNRHQPYKKDIRQISCKRCLSRNGLHTSDKCPSTKWCDRCGNASHNRPDCRFN